jgi:hypothetical protein
LSEADLTSRKTQCLRICNDFLGLIFLHQKAGVLGKNVFRVREPTLISTHQRQIAAVEAYGGRRREVVRGRQRPVNVSGQEGMVARMVVKVGNQGIEANAAEEFASIFVRLCDDAYFLD